MSRKTAAKKKAPVAETPVEGAVPVLKDRIIDFRRIGGDELQAHEHSWRVHPESQKAALNSALAEIGIADALIVYESERQQGMTIIDGRMRAEEHETTKWPCLVVDLTDEEADLMLMVADPITSMAQMEIDRVESLTAVLKPDTEALQSLIQVLRQEAGIMPPQDESFPEYDATEREKVAFHECPSCGYQWPK